MNEKNPYPPNPDSDETSADPHLHALGTGFGAVAGAAAGVAAGVAGGPVGMAIGGAIGAAAGGLAGRGLGEMVNPTTEDGYWKIEHAHRPASSVAPYDTFRPAYRYGWESRQRFAAARGFEDLESELEREWSGARGTSSLSWAEARPAVRDAWERVARLHER